MTILTINVTNNMPLSQGFYFFQAPSVFTGGQMVQGVSLFSQALGPYEQTGATLTFQVDAQPYACIQEASHMARVGQMAGFATASRPIDLAGQGPRTATAVSVRPLGLSQPTADAGVQPGAFRITIPPFAPTEIYNIGSGVQVNWRPMLSSFVQAHPAYILDVQPVLKFYVATGDFTVGTVINAFHATMHAALCDFTGGRSVINVTFNDDGTWTVQVMQ